jgi:hypothetical protein
MNSNHDDPLKTPISLIFRWTESGLHVHQAPDKLDNYPITQILQRSLKRPFHTPSPTHPTRDDKPLIPFGVVANLLHRTEWCNLNLNFEPGTDLKLRVYISVDDFRLKDISHPVRVTLLMDEHEISNEMFRKGSFQSPPLLPGHYRFIIRQEEVILTEIQVVLQ